MFIYQQDGIANYPKAKQQNSTCSLTVIYWDRNLSTFQSREIRWSLKNTDDYCIFTWTKRKYS